MNANQDLLNKFYTAFKNKDVTGMQDCYSDQATFNDPVFTDLNAQQVRAMWAMLIQSGKDMRVEFTAVKATENGGTAHWDAHYTFSATGKKVWNQVDAVFIIENGKIVQHQDHFDFYKWSKQALGLPGMLLGWTTFLRSKVKKQASEKLAAYMSRK